MTTGNGKKVYGFNPVHKLEEGKYVTAITGWVFENDKQKPTYKTVTTANGNKNVMNFKINSSALKSRLEFLGLPNADKETLWIDCTAWERIADRLNKLNIKKGFQLLVFGTLVIEENDKGYKGARLNIEDFSVLRFPKKDDSAGNNSSVDDDFIPEDEDGDMPF